MGCSASKTASSGRRTFWNIDSLPQTQYANSSFLTEAKWNSKLWWRTDTAVSCYYHDVRVWTSTTHLWRDVGKYQNLPLKTTPLLPLLWWHVHTFQNPLCFDHGCHLQTCLATLVNRSTELGVNRRGQISAAFSGRGPNERQAEETERDWKHGN